MTKWVFTVDGRQCGYIRSEWEQAAQDAVSAGYAVWIHRPYRIKLDATQGADIERVEK